MDKSYIQRVTKEYWCNFDPSRLNQVIESYVCQRHARLDDKSLLEAELDYARRAGSIVITPPCKTLVLLVGFSLEPLMQSVCVYQPGRVVMVLNEEGYAGETWQVFARHVTEAIGLLVTKKLLPQPPQLPGKNGTQGYPSTDRADAVFQTLVEILHDDTDVVIDVTGGKKSMVSGAYIYGAYSGGRISYVDFDEYDAKWRRPYGYSCKIGELANPYKEFALRDWEHVRAMYERHQFREARKILKDEIMPTMLQVMHITRSPIQMLAAFLEYYEKWDLGDYRGAKQAAKNLPDFEQPSAVTELGDEWFEISNKDFVKKPNYFYGNLPALQVYVCDELRRIRRLIEFNEDYRSAFLRAGGLNEIVMLARVAGLVTNPTERDLLLCAMDDRTPDARRVFESLTDSTGKDITIGNDKKCDISFKNAPTLKVPHPVPMNPWWKRTTLFDAENGWETFLTKRNELAHKYFSVPLAWAEEALKFVQANFEDFLGRPIAALGLRTTALSWPELIDLCNLSHFLPPSLRKEI